MEELVHELTGCPKNKIKLYYEDIESWRSDKVVKSYGWAGVNDTGEDVFDYIEKNNIDVLDDIDKNDVKNYTDEIKNNINKDIDNERNNICSK